MVAKYYRSRAGLLIGGNSFKKIPIRELNMENMGRYEEHLLIWGNGKYGTR